MDATRRGIPAADDEEKIVIKRMPKNFASPKCEDSRLVALIGVCFTLSVCFGWHFRLSSLFANFLKTLAKNAASIVRVRRYVYIRVYTYNYVHITRTRMYTYYVRVQMCIASFSFQPLNMRRLIFVAASTIATQLAIPSAPRRAAPRRA